MITTNISECMNSVHTNAINMPIVQLLRLFGKSYRSGSLTMGRGYKSRVWGISSHNKHVVFILLFYSFLFMNLRGQLCLFFVCYVTFFVTFLCCSHNHAYFEIFDEGVQETVDIVLLIDLLWCFSSDWEKSLYTCSRDLI